MTALIGKAGRIFERAALALVPAAATDKACVWIDVEFQSATACTFHSAYASRTKPVRPARLDVLSGGNLILATVSSDPAFHKDVRASLDGHLRFEATWDLSYEDGNRLRGIGPEQQCILIVDFADLALPCRWPGQWTAAPK